MAHNYIKSQTEGLNDSLKAHKIIEILIDAEINKIKYQCIDLDKLDSSKQEDLKEILTLADKLIKECNTQLIKIDKKEILRGIDLHECTICFDAPCWEVNKEREILENLKKNI